MSIIARGPLPADFLYARFAGGGGGGGLRAVGPVRLHQADACTSDAGRRRGGCERAAHVQGDALLIGELPLRRRAVKLRVIKFLQAVLREQQDVLRGGEVRQVLDIGRVLLLPQLCRLCHRLVKRLDGVLKRFDLALERRDGPLLICDRLLEIRNVLLQGLLLVICCVELCQAVLLLRVVVRLFFREQCNKLVDHLDDLIEAHLLAPQREGQEVEARVVALRGLESGKRPLPNLARGYPHLQEAGGGGGQRFLKQLERVVVVQDLDGVCQSYELQ